MLKVIATVALVVFCAGAGMAADIMTFSAMMGTVTFQHKAHQERLKGCSSCHEKEPGKIDNFGKDFAHKTCKGCHADKGAGPTKCSECHKK